METLEIKSFDTSRKFSFQHHIRVKFKSEILIETFLSFEDIIRSIIKVT